MLVILSNAEDQTTNIVIDWLKYDFLRINPQDSIAAIDIKITNHLPIEIIFELRNIKFSLQNISGFWYRRGDFTLLLALKLSSQVEKILLKEWNILKKYVHYQFSKINHIGNFFSEENQNKMIALHEAKNVGLLVPLTRILSNKKDFELNGKRYITKALFNSFSLTTENGSSQTIMTERIDHNHIDLLSDSFFPTLIQEEINKQFELRIFFINDIFYPMAIFSQKDEKTNFGL